MKVVDIKDKSEYLYDGAFDISEDNKDVVIDATEPIRFNLNHAVNSSAQVSKLLSIDDLKEICKLVSIKATIYPNGNLGFRKLDSSTEDLKTCYVSIVDTEKNRYIVCIAFDETQPTRYRAQLLGVFLFASL